MTSVKLHFSVDYAWARKTAPSRAGSLHIRCMHYELPFEGIDEHNESDMWSDWCVYLTFGGALPAQCTCVLERDLSDIAGLVGAADAAGRFEKRYLPSLDIRPSDEYRTRPRFEERCGICDRPKKQAIRGRYLWVTTEDVPVNEGEK